MANTKAISQKASTITPQPIADISLIQGVVKAMVDGVETYKNALIHTDDVIPTPPQDYPVSDISNVNMVECIMVDSTVTPNAYTRTLVNVLEFIPTTSDILVSLSNWDSITIETIIDIKRDDIIIYNGIPYISTTGIIDTENAPDVDTVNWSTILVDVGVSLYSETISYNMQEIVTANGGFYVSKQPNNIGNILGDNTDWWLRVSNIGKPIVYWNDVAMFETTDIVTHGGVLWVAINNTQGDEPSSTSSNWDMLGGDDPTRGVWVKSPSSVDMVKFDTFSDAIDSVQYQYPPTDVYVGVGVYDIGDFTVTPPFVNIHGKGVGATTLSGSLTILSDICELDHITIETDIAKPALTVGDFDAGNMVEFNLHDVNITGNSGADYAVLLDFINMDSSISTLNVISDDITNGVGIGVNNASGGPYHNISCTGFNLGIDIIQNQAIMNLNLSKVGIYNCVNGLRLNYPDVTCTDVVIGGTSEDSGIGIECIDTDTCNICGHIEKRGDGAAISISSSTSDTILVNSAHIDLNVKLLSKTPIALNNVKLSGGSINISGVVGDTNAISGVSLVSIVNSDIKYGTISINTPMYTGISRMGASVWESTHAISHVSDTYNGVHADNIRVVDTDYVIVKPGYMWDDIGDGFIFIYKTMRGMLASNIHSISTVTTADVPVVGAVVGDTILDLTYNDTSDMDGGFGPSTTLNIMASGMDANISTTTELYGIQDSGISRTGYSLYNSSDIPDVTVYSKNSPCSPILYLWETTGNYYIIGGPATSVDDVGKYTTEVSGVVTAISTKPNVYPLYYDMD